eukprot:CAMPEP_0179211478 /NCGR_PEP_ID=MMETSP0797-20121207/486_1 /TAXON_ID=47934 /ORGANISM="Dinophysis acuminata, Strain DAEP01" /LENGTH=42 /DNA_ID= /DNA_START= /DNA_END= /DNA_ORIENTATION=
MRIRLARSSRAHMHRGQADMHDAPGSYPPQLREKKQSLLNAR